MKNILSIILSGVFIVSCSSSNDFDKEKYLKLGKETAQATGKVLLKNVKKTIKEQGPFEAISFCNMQAYPITDSLSKMHQANIKRVAIKFRNTDNKANEQEQEIINKYIKQLSQNKELKALVEKSGNTINFYAPIKVQKACLTCHGSVGTAISDTLYSHIKGLYPSDLAVNFKEDELRGIWSISFKE